MRIACRGHQITRRGSATEAYKPFPAAWEEDAGPVSTDLGFSSMFNADECTIVKNGLSYSVSADRTRTVPNRREAMEQSSQRRRNTSGPQSRVQRNDGRPTVKERPPPEQLSDTELSDPFIHYYVITNCEGVTGEIVCL